MRLAQQNCFLSVSQLLQSQFQKSKQFSFFFKKFVFTYYFSGVLRHLFSKKKTLFNFMFSANLFRSSNKESFSYVFISSLHAKKLGVSPNFPGIFRNFVNWTWLETLSLSFSFFTKRRSWSKETGNQNETIRKSLVIPQSRCNNRK